MQSPCTVWCYRVRELSCTGMLSCWLLSSELLADCSEHRFCLVIINFALAFPSLPAVSFTHQTDSYALRFINLNAISIRQEGEHRSLTWRAVIFVLVDTSVGHPVNYQCFHLDVLYIGSEHLKSTWFNFENKITDDERHTVDACLDGSGRKLYRSTVGPSDLESDITWQHHMAPKHIRIWVFNKYSIIAIIVINVWF